MNVIITNNDNNNSPLKIGKCVDKLILDPTYMCASDESVPVPAG